MPKKKLTDAEIEAILRRFREEEDMRMDEAEEEIERLRSVRKRVIPRLLQMLTTGDEREAGVASMLLVELGDKRAIRELQKLIHRRDIPDDRKMLIFPVLVRLGVPVDGKAFFSSLQDPDTAMRKSIRQALVHLQTPFEVSDFLEIIEHQMPIEARAAYIETIGSLGEPHAIPLLRCLAHSPEEVMALTAIAALDNLKAVEAIPDLEELGQYGLTPTIRKEARKVAGRLTMRASVKGEEHPPYTMPIWPLDTCYLSAIDGNGTQMAVVVRRRPDGRLAIVNFMYNDHEGVKDAYGGDMMAEEDVEEVLDLMEMSGLSLAPVPLARCRQTIEEAHLINLKTRRPPPLTFYAWRFFLAGEDTSEVEEIPVEEVDIKAHPELVEECDDLFLLDEFDSWFFAPEQWPGHARAFRALEKIRGQPDAKAKAQRLIKKYLAEVVDKKMRRLLRERLRRQAYMLAQIYEDEEPWQWAMAAAAALEDDSEVPLHEHPLLYEMMDRTLRIPPRQVTIWREPFR